MQNDIEPFFQDVSGCESINISKIGKYGKFINFGGENFLNKDTSLFPDEIPFMFHTDAMAKVKLGEDDIFTAMINLEINLKSAIESDLKNNYELQNKINAINIKAKQKIEKLTEKTRKKMKLKEKYRMDLVEKYFEPKLESGAEFSAFSKEQPSSP